PVVSGRYDYETVYYGDRRRQTPCLAERLHPKRHYNLGILSLHHRTQSPLDIRGSILLALSSQGLLDFRNNVCNHRILGITNNKDFCGTCGGREQQQEKEEQRRRKWFAARGFVN